MPIRMCAVCRERHEKRSLNRIVKDESGEIKLDKSQTVQSRGIYICDGCMPCASKKRVLERRFKQSVPASVYEELCAEAGGESREH